MVWGIILFVIWAAMIILLSLYKKADKKTCFSIAFFLAIAFMVILFILMTSTQKGSVGVASQERVYDYYVNGKYVGRKKEHSTVPVFGNLLASFLGGAVAFLIAWLIAKVIASGTFMALLIFMLIFLTLGIAMLITGAYFMLTPNPARDYREAGPIVLTIGGVSMLLSVICGVLMPIYKKKHPEG